MLKKCRIHLVYENEDDYDGDEESLNKNLHTVSHRLTRFVNSPEEHNSNSNTTNEDGGQEDGVSLLALRAAITEDPKQALSTWLDSDSTPCKWAGITCDEIHHRVTSIELSTKNLTGYISSGSLPQGLSNLTHLTGTLNLSFNQFSGEIPASFGLFPVMLSLDLRHNNLTGKIPEVGSLLNQGPTAFSGNLYLCGFPLNTQCTIPEAQNPIFSTNPQKPENPGVSSDGFVENKKIKIGPVTFSVISGVFAVAGLGFLSVWVRRKWRVAAEGKTGKEENVNQEVRPEEGQKGKFAVVDEGLSEGDNTRRFKEFEAEVEAIGRVHHPNIVKLRAYYYASDEKLLVSDFVRNGSLYTALHGGPANSLPPLSWAARLGIAQGVAKARDAGCKFTQKCDVYSFGIVLLEILTGRAPDVAPDNDCKGLEGLVRKIFREEQPLSKIIDPALLHEVHAKKQVVAAFHIALSCTELDPEFRPRMRTVSENLDCIKSWYK
ncbi:Leucine-rich repeat protein kinase family protein [Forsythia ovata]|uniref:Leucine-rich repeat protein kinase family protein n=1 Tax=Forsythia ovata TaxID=205694 RepID=A0ABD1PLC4_9LAMI